MVLQTEDPDAVGMTVFENYYAGDADEKKKGLKSKFRHFVYFINLC